MKTLFDYCWYKISKFYKDWGETYAPFSGGIILFGCIGFNFLSVLCFLFALLDKDFPSSRIKVMIAGAFIVLSFFYSSEKRYKALRKKYKIHRDKPSGGLPLRLYTWDGPAGALDGIHLRSRHRRPAPNLALPKHRLPLRGRNADGESARTLRRTYCN